MPSLGSISFWPSVVLPLCPLSSNVVPLEGSVCDGHTIYNIGTIWHVAH